MPRITKAVPAYCLHMASGHAVVTLDGHDYYLGPHGSRASRIEYDRRIGGWLAAGRRLPSTAAALSALELVHGYWKFAKQHYCKAGEPTHKVANIRSAL